MAKKRGSKIRDFFGFGTGEYEDDEEYFEEEEEDDGYETRTRSRERDEYEAPRRTRKARVVPVQERRGNSKSSVIIFSPKTYNEAQPLVMQLIQHKHVIIKLDKVDRKVAQRILDFMSGAAYASDAQVTEVSKGSIYLFASNQTYIEASEGDVHSSGDEGYTLEDDKT